MARCSPRKAAGFAILTVFFIVVILKLRAGANDRPFIEEVPPFSTSTQMTRRLPVTNHDLLSFAFVQKKCFPSISNVTAYNIAHVAELIQSCTDPIVLASRLPAMLTELFDIETRTGELHIPEDFMPKIRTWLDNKEPLIAEVSKQVITTVFNRVTHESVVFNPLRANRPGPTGTGARDYVEFVVAESAGDCDFCRAKTRTAEDVFGRIETQHTITGANAFKYSQLHGLIMFKHHNPTVWSRAQFLELMGTAMEWFRRAHAHTPALSYPHLMWDILPKASASQIHPHTQASLGTKRYSGFGAHLMDVAAMYGAAHGGSSYFTHLIQVHEALGLALRYEDATVLTYLTPKKDWEMVVIAEKPSKAFFTLVHHTLRAYLDDMTLLSFSVAMFFPALNDAPSLPAIARIVERGVPASIRSDISAMELFAHSNVDVDPFVAARNMLPAIRRALARDPS